MKVREYLVNDAFKIQLLTFVSELAFLFTKKLEIEYKPVPYVGEINWTDNMNVTLFSSCISIYCNSLSQTIE